MPRYARLTQENPTSSSTARTTTVDLNGTWELTWHDGERALPDNFFDLLPGLPYELPWPAALGEPRVLRIGNGETDRG